MLRVTMEIIPKGNEKKKFVAGVLEIANNQTGNFPTEGNYDLKISGPVDAGGDIEMNGFWQYGKLDGFKREYGWWECVKEALCKLELKYNVSHTD